MHADERRAAFSDGWTVEAVAPETFHINEMHGTTRVRAWLAAIQRL